MRRSIRALGSNAGQCLFSGIANEKQAAQIAARLARDGYDGPVTFGPFADRDEAVRFTDCRYGGFVYDDRVNRASLCGPWLP